MIPSSPAAGRPRLRPLLALLPYLARHKDRVAAALAALGYDRVTITRDLAGRERVVDGVWHG